MPLKKRFTIRKLAIGCILSTWLVVVCVFIILIGNAHV